MLQPPLSVLLLIFTGNLAHELKSPRVTNYGDWYEWANCPTGTYAAGIQIKAEGDQRGGDDTGLNAVALYCLPFNWGSFQGSKWIMSGEGLFGSWQAVKWCPKGQVIIGFQLRSENDQRGKDDVAADNFAAFCGSPFRGRDENNYIMGDTEGWGHWTAKQWCSEGYAVCSIKSQIEGNQRGGDDTSLNNVDLWCCKVDYNCKPDVQRVTLDTYDNRRGPGDMTFEYTVTTSFTRMSSTSDTLTIHEKQIIANKISTELGIAGSGLSAKVASEFSKSREIGSMRALQTMVQETVQRTYQKKLTIKIPAGKRVIIEQMYFTCGGYRMGIAKTINRQY